MDLVELKVEIPIGDVEAVDTALLEHGVDAWSVTEDVIVKRAWLVGIFESRLGAREAWAAVRAVLPLEAWPEAEMRDLAADDWRNSYRAHFKAWKFGRLHWVPEWERDTYVVPPGDAVLWLDPGLAFGTGNHETTRLCVDRLVDFERELTKSGAKLDGVSVIDAGCGSGILALSALRLGFCPVEGFDSDPEAVRVSEENAALNGLNAGVTFFVGDLVTGLRERSAGVVFANILADVLMRHAHELVAAVEPGGRLILSGILATENRDVQAVFAKAAPGWPIEAHEMGEWSDVVLSRPKR